MDIFVNSAKKKEIFVIEDVNGLDIDGGAETFIYIEHFPYYTDKSSYGEIFAGDTIHYNKKTLHVTNANINSLYNELKQIIKD